VALVTCDVVAWLVACAAGAVLHGIDRFDVATLVPIGVVAAVACAAQLLVGGFRELYVGRYGVGSPDDTVNVAATFGLAGATAFTVGVLDAAAPWAVSLIALPIALVVAVGARLAYRLHRDGGYLPDAPDATVPARRVVVYGANEAGRHVLAAMLADPARRYRPVALLDDNPGLVNRRVHGVPVRGRADDVATVAGIEEADLLIVAGHPADAAVTRRLTAAAGRIGMQVRVVPPLTELIVGPGPQQQAAPRRGDAARAVARNRAKRLFDVTLCLLAMPVLVPLGFALTLLVALSSSDEVIYRARRTGRNGRPFTMYKFSGMAGAAAGPRVTHAGDTRITRVGRVLRATKLDELPQVLNVLKGDMSIVGPRPEDPRYLAHYTDDQLKILLVRPGMTSASFLRFGDEQSYLAEHAPTDVETYYLQELLPEKLTIEFDYVMDWSLRRDLRIIGRTFVGLLT
jgi:lipopolysaccharide/colanic/teichoic acid biosynthesis glycosyltransferase